MLKKSLLLLSVLLLSAVIGEAQFFTKSSKSIPRMGRRSDELLAASISRQRALVDDLIDRIGPINLIAAIEAKQRTLNDDSNSIYAGMMDSGADYDGLGMEPSRVLDKYSMEPVDGGSQQHAGQSYVVLAKRSISQKQMDNENRNSFALRALNAEHFMKHLSSGQPLLAPRGDRAPANHSQAPSALGNLLFSKRSIVEGQGESSLVD